MEAPVAPSPSPTHTSPAVRSFSEHLHDAWKLYTNYFWQYIGMLLVALVGLVPGAIVAVFVAIAGFAAYMNTGEGMGAIIPMPVLMLIGIAAIAFAIYVATLSQIGLFLQIQANAAGKPQGIWQHLKNASTIFWPYLGMNILSVVLILAGFVALIIPGLIMIVLFTFAQWVLIAEQAGPVAALKRSYALVSKNAATVLIRWYLVLAGTWIISAIFQSLFRESSAGFGPMQGLLSLVSFVLTPLFTAYLYMLYRDIANKPL